MAGKGDRVAAPPGEFGAPDGTSAPVPPDLADYMQMAEHPRFAEAARAIGASAVETARLDPVMCQLCKDAGRYAAALAAIHLHDNGGLSLPGFKAVCAATGLLSPGRARDLLQYLQHVRFVEPDGHRPGSLAQWYRPTDRFTVAWAEHLRGPVAAAAIVAPDAQAVLRRWDDPAVRAAFVRLQGESLLRSTETRLLEGPISEAFYHPLASVQILSLLVAGGDGVSFPSPTPVPIPLAATARWLLVTPVHIRRTLNKAIGFGLLEKSPAGYRFAERAAPLRLLYAAQLVHLLEPVRQTLALLPEEPVPA